MINLILFGPPGSGKGTQAAMLKEYFNLLHISTGDLLRQEIKNETVLGMEAKKFMDKGELVSDAVVTGMINNCIDAAKNQGKSGIIFDGYPRTTEQAIALDELLKNKSTTIHGVLSLTVDEEELTKRILKRGLTSGRTDDTDIETIKRRVNEYRDKTQPVAAYYKSENKYHEINGIGSVDEIFQELVQAIKNLSSTNN